MGFVTLVVAVVVTTHRLVSYGKDDDPSLKYLCNAMNVQTHSTLAIHSSTVNGTKCEPKRCKGIIVRRMCMFRMLALSWKTVHTTVSHQPHNTHTQTCTHAHTHTYWEIWWCFCCRRNGRCEILLRTRSSLRAHGTNASSRCLHSTPDIRDMNNFVGGFVLILALWFIIDILQSPRLNSSSISLLLVCFILRQRIFNAWHFAP